MIHSSKQNNRGNAPASGAAASSTVRPHSPLPAPNGRAQDVANSQSSLVDPSLAEPNSADLDQIETQQPATVAADPNRTRVAEGSAADVTDQEQFDPHAVWQMLLGELALQMPSATFNTWVRDTWVVAYEDGEFIIGLPNAYARDWLENRLRNKIKRSLSSLIHRSVQVQFLVRPRSVSDPVDAKPVPLYATGAAEQGRADGVSADLNRAGPNAPPVPPKKRGADMDKPREVDSHGVDPHGVDSHGVDSTPVPPLPTEQPAVGALGNDAVQPDVSLQEAANPYAPARRSEDRGQQDYYADRDVLAARIPLNGQYTFETFVVGNHNKLAHAAAEAISERPGQSFNPLFVYGGVGLGKTHLLHSIGHRAKQQGFHMLYVSSEQFTNELIGAIRSQSTEQFRNKYRQVDILLIDDIQFISGKESTQEEFFHTFNHLHASGRQVVLSSDRPPKMLATLDDRLRSRFEGGLQTDIAQPDFETRVAILQSKAKRMAAAVDHSVLMMVAERVDSNIRELEGALNRLIVQARLMHTPLTLSVATTILDNLAPERTVCAPEIIIRIVAEHFQLKADDLCGRKRTKEIAGARQIAMFILREEHSLSLPAIGDLLGGRDHSTVRYGVEKITEDLAEDESLRQAVATLREKIYTPFAA